MRRRLDCDHTRRHRAPLTCERLDGAIIGLTLAYAAVRTIVKFTSSSSTLHKLQDAPSVRVATSGPCSPSKAVRFGARFVEPVGTKDLVIVRGLVEAKSAVEGGTWKSLRQNVLVSQDCDSRAVIVQRTQTMSVCTRTLLD